MKSLIPLLIVGTILGAGYALRSNPEWAAKKVAPYLAKMCGWETDDNPWTNPDYYSMKTPKFDHSKALENMQGPPAFKVPKMHIPKVQVPRVHVTN